MRLSFEPNVTYTKLVVCERFLNVQTSKQRGKNCNWLGPLLRRRAPSMVQPASGSAWKCRTVMQGMKLQDMKFLH